MKIMKRFFSTFELIWTNFCPLMRFFQKREAFCQLLQLMKNKHSNQDEPDMISIFIGTWNMGQEHKSTM